MERTRFQRPWRVTVIPGGFRVDNANGLALGYFYWWNSPNSAHQAGVLKRDEAMLMAETFSQMPESDAWRPRRDPPHQPARQLGALLAPAGLLPANLERAAVEGRLPLGIGLARLFDAPVAWSRQHRMLGLAH